eukprot:768465-Hanusia_phi.AAC.4
MQDVFVDDDKYEDADVNDTILGSELRPVFFQHGDHILSSRYSDCLMFLFLAPIDKLSVNKKAKIVPALSEAERRRGRRAKSVKDCVGREHRCWKEYTAADLRGRACIHCGTGAPLEVAASQRILRSCCGPVLNICVHQLQRCFLRKIRVQRQVVQRHKFYFKMMFALLARYIFAENCAQTGLFNDVEYSIYKVKTCHLSATGISLTMHSLRKDWHTWLIESFDNLRLDGIVYLRTKPETCLERLKKRARSEEGGIPLEYLQEVEGCCGIRREIGFVMSARKVANTPILVLECDRDMSKHPEMEVEKHERAIERS